MEPLTSEQIAQNWVKWLDALASGKYKKTIKTLHRHVDGEERHCCLGVAQICLGIPREDYARAMDIRLIEPLGLATSCGLSSNSLPDNGKFITELNDLTYEKDLDFRNMHRELLADIEGFTHKHPEVAPLVRKMLSERNS